jgi:hypothetical protein
MLRLRYVYVPSLAPSDKERTAFLTFFASSDIRDTSKQSYAKTANLDDSLVKHTGTIELQLVLSNTDAVAKDASVTVQAWVHCENTHGEPAIDQAGYARFYLEELLAQRGSHGAVELRVANADNYVKGTIDLSVDHCDDCSTIVFAASASAYDWRGKAQFEKALRAVEKHASMSQLAYEHLPMTRGYESMQMIHAPFYRVNGIVLPGVAFALIKADAPSPTAYYENLLDIVLRRQYPSKRSIVEARDHLVHGASWREVSLVLAKMLCVFVNSCCYLLDGVWQGRRGSFRSILSPAKMQPIESFDTTPRLTHTSDCEDDALQCCLEARDIRDLVFESEAMKRVQQARRAMEIEMLLLGVSGASLHDAMASGQRARFGGHMAARLTAKREFLERFARTSTKKHVFIGDEAYDEVPAWSTTLPILSLEGTGCLEPDCTHDMLGPLHSYLASDDESERALYRLKYSVHQPRDKEHSFYKSIQSSFLVDRMDAGYACGEAAYVVLDAHGKVSTSVPYPLSLKLGDAQVGQWFCEELDNETRAWLPSLMKHIHPVEPHVAPAEGTRVLVRNQLLESLVRNKSLLLDQRWRNIDYTLRSYQLTRERVSALGKLFGKKRAVVKVEYFREPVTSTLTNWLLRVWIDPAMAGMLFLGEEDV